MSESSVSEPHKNNETAVKVNGLSKTFYSGFFAPIPYLRQKSLGRLHRVVKAVNDVSFEIKQGEIFALLGSNGAGKSTTMKMLMGLISPSSGVASIFEKDIVSASARRSVGYLPENPSFYDELTPKELLRLFCALHGVHARQEKQHIDHLIERVGMSYAADRPLRKLSKGMHQRIGVAQALINAPDLIVLDEPFSGLDPIGRHDIREVLLQERERGATLLFTSHILPDVEALCDRFLILDHGEVKHQGALADLSLNTADIDLTVIGGSNALTQALTHMGCVLMPRRASQDKTLSAYNVPHQRSEKAIALVFEHQAQIYSLNRLKPQLESMFMNQTSSDLQGQLEREKTKP